MVKNCLSLYHKNPEEYYPTSRLYFSLMFPGLEAGYPPKHPPLSPAPSSSYDLRTAAGVIKPDS